MSLEANSCSSTYLSSFMQEDGCNHDIEGPRSRSYDHWDHLFELVNNVDKNICEQRRENLERQYQIALFGAGCLSTAILDSYKWLTNNPTRSYIAQYFISVSTGDHVHSHTTQSVFLGTTGQFQYFNAAAIINALWLLSLVMMCFVLLICSLSLHCLGEFRNLPQFESKRLLAFRQMHYNGLRRCNIFAMCDAVHLILPLAFMLSFSGVILLLWLLNQLDSYLLLSAFGFIIVYFLFAILNPFFRSLFRRETLGFSPFTSPASWSLFKVGHGLISIVFKVGSRRKQKQLECPISPRKARPSLHDISRRAQDSGDWLEYGCSTLFHPQNTEVIDVLLADALIWVDSNPTIEKSKKLVFSIYYCILDLTSPEVFTQLDYTPQVFRSELASIFFDVAHGHHYNGYRARYEASVLWLTKMHAEQPLPIVASMNRPPIYCTKYLHDEPTHTDMCLSSPNVLQSKDFSRLDTVLRKLETAKKFLARGMYYRGTFNIIYEIMIAKTGSIDYDSRIQELTASVFYECQKFIRRFTFRDERHLQEAKSYAEELEVFVRDANEIANDFCATLEASWSRIITKANSLLPDVERLLYPGANSSELTVMATGGMDGYLFDAV